VTPDQLRAARQIVEITAVLAHLNVVARQAAPLLDAALDGVCSLRPVATVSLMRPGAPTDTGGPEAVRNVLAPIATRLGASISQITLAWLLARSPAIMPVPGRTSITHLRETSMRTASN
jgi:pyridoxine 4-dehydrogenase